MEAAACNKWCSLSLFAVFSVAAIILCCKADPKMSSNGDLSVLGSSDSFWEVQMEHIPHTDTLTEKMNCEIINYICSSSYFASQSPNHTHSHTDDREPTN